MLPRTYDLTGRQLAADRDEDAFRQRHSARELIHDYAAVDLDVDLRVRQVTPNVYNRAALVEFGNQVRGGYVLAVTQFQTIPGHLHKFLHQGSEKSSFVSLPRILCEPQQAQRE
jgi:hypothetical protein